MLHLRENCGSNLKVTHCKTADSHYLQIYHFDHSLTTESFSDLELHFFMGFLEDELIVCFFLLQITPTDWCSSRNWHFA